MITLKDFLEVANYRITEGSDYGWDCYGPNTYSLDSWNGDQDGFSLSVTFDTVTQEVYEVQAHNYRDNFALRCTNDKYAGARLAEAATRGADDSEAWDDCAYEELTPTEFIGKALTMRWSFEDEAVHA